MGRIAYEVTTTVGPSQEEYQSFVYYVLLCYPYHSPLVRQGNQVSIVIELDYWNYKVTDWFDSYQERGAIGPWTYRRI